MSIHIKYTNNAPQWTATVALIAAVLSLAVFSVFLMMSSSASATPRFVRIGVPDGLSDHTVTCILQDSAGFMWFGTMSGGLNRYDGVEYTVYKHDENDSTSISDNFIYSLFEDSSGTLWIGTNSGGLNRYDHATESFTRMFDGAGGGPALSGIKINRIIEDSRGRLWIGCKSGLNCYDPGTGEIDTFAHEPLLSNVGVGALYKDENGPLWVGTSQGLVRLDPDTGSAINFEGFENETCSSIIPAGDGTLWLSNYYSGLQHFDPVTGAFTVYNHDPDDPHSIPDNNVGYLATDNAGTLWVGTYRGLCSYEAETGRFIRHLHNPNDSASISTNGIWPLYIDRTGILWVGTFMGGLNKLVNPETVFDYHPLGSGTLSSITQGEIFSFFEDSRGRFWIGCREGIIVTGPDLENPRKVDFRNTNDIAMLSKLSDHFLEDLDGHIWAYRWRKDSLTLFDEKTGVFITPPDSELIMTEGLLDINMNSDGNFWICMNQGLSIYKPRSKRIVHSITGNVADSLFTDRHLRTSMLDGHGSFWAGNVDGLNIMDISTMEVTKLFDGGDHSEYAKLHNIISITHGPNDTILLGTNYGLLEYSHDSKRFRTLVESAALIQESVIAIAVDKRGTIWFTTNTLLGSYNPKEETLRTFELADGLPFNSNALKSMYCDSNGMVYVGGNKGFYRFDPASIPVNEISPLVEITSFRKFNHDIPLGDALGNDNAITLSYRDTFFSFGFAALDYTAPDKNEYAYKMEGFDKDWVEIGNERTATYTNLDPGTYNFRVRAANSDGVWNNEGASVQIVITPPFWQRWWFRLCAIFMIAGAALLAHYMRVMMIKRQRAHLQEVVATQTKSLQEAAVTDELTGLYNRRYFNEFLAYHWKDGSRKKTPLSIILCDIDYFKKYNDLYGHIPGDNCLKTVAGVLAANSHRPGDIVARYGGEEFIIVLPDTTESGAVHIAETMLTAIRDEKIPHEASEIAEVITISFGVAVTHPTPNCKPEAFVNAADTALYKAKEQGRNRVVSTTYCTDKPS